MTSLLPAQRGLLGLVMLVACLTPLDAPAHEGEEAGPAAPTALTVPPHPTHVATTSDMEIVARHEPFQPGRAEDLLLYVNDWATNAPIAGARLSVSIRSSQGVAWQGTAVAGTLPGAYRTRPLLQRAGTYNLIVQVTGPRRASVAMPGVVVGAAKEESHAPAKKRSAPWVAAAILLSLVAGLAAGLGLGRRRRTPAPQKLLILGLLLHAAFTVRVATAHEGHDTGPAGATASLQDGGTVWLAKESQFAAKVRTVLATPDARAQQVTLLGRVAPSPRGKADVLAPQAGRLDAIGGRFPTLGQTVRRGQPLASLLVIDALPVRAPIGGVISDVSTVPGQAVQAGQKLFEVVDLAEVWVHADAFPSDLAATGAASRALIAVPGLSAGPVLTGRRVATGTAAGETPGTVELWFAVANRDGLLKPGAIVNVAVETAHLATGIRVPRSALLDRNGRTVAFVHTAPEQFEMRAVTVQPGAGDPVLVTSGLTAGERIVVSGAYQILTGGTPLAGR